MLCSAEVYLLISAGGGVLAEKLVETYFTLFKFILEGKLGHGGQLAAAKEEKASLPSKKSAKPGKKGGKKGGKPAQGNASLPSGAAQRAPSSIEQVIHRRPELFVTCIVTTGVFSRPSTCSARFWLACC